MIRNLVCYILMGLPAWVLAADGGVSRGHVFFRTDFEGASAAAGWTGAVKFEPGYKSERALVRAAGAGEKGSTVSIKLPAERMRGCTVRGAAMIKAENVSAKPNGWNGIKCMLAIETPDRKLWPQADIGVGSFDWQKAGFSARIPADATAVTLVLGMEMVSGKVWFDDVEIAVAKAPVMVKGRVQTGPAWRGHNLPRLRGTMISPNITPESLKLLGKQWGANLIRWQLIRHGKPGEDSNLENYDQWLEGELKKLDAALPLCEQYGVYVALDLHSPPGGKSTVSGYVGSDAGLFRNKRAQEKFVEVWRQMAKRYKGAKAIWGFDIANEPVEDFVEDDCDDWQSLAERVGRAIREVDPDRTLIIEPSAWGGPDGLADLAPLPLSNVVYSVHMYMPHAFTHQGVHSRGTELKYPGIIHGRQWDKAQLLKALQPAIDFQKKYNVHIYIGEFSAIRWAPDNSAYRYLRDVDRHI